MKTETVKESGKSKRGRPRTAVNGDATMSRSFAARESEFRVWEAKAAAENRSFSSWVRLRLLAADARDEELAARASELRDRQ